MSGKSPQCSQVPWLQVFQGAPHGPTKYLVSVRGAKLQCCLDTREKRWPDEPIVQYNVHMQSHHIIQKRLQGTSISK